MAEKTFCNVSPKNSHTAATVPTTIPICRNGVSKAVVIASEVERAAVRNANSETAAKPGRIFATIFALSMLSIRVPRIRNFSPTLSSGVKTLSFLSTCHLLRRSYEHVGTTVSTRCRFPRHGGFPDRRKSVADNRAPPGFFCGKNFFVEKPVDSFFFDELVGPPMPKPVTGDFSTGIGEFFHAIFLVVGELVRPVEKERRLVSIFFEQRALLCPTFEIRGIIERQDDSRLGDDVGFFVSCAEEKSDNPKKVKMKRMASVMVASKSEELGAA